MRLFKGPSGFLSRHKRKLAAGVCLGALGVAGYQGATFPFPLPQRLREPARLSIAASVEALSDEARVKRLEEGVARVPVRSESGADRLGLTGFDKEDDGRTVYPNGETLSQKLAFPGGVIKINTRRARTPIEIQLGNNNGTVKVLETYFETLSHEAVHYNRLTSNHHFASQAYGTYAAELQDHLEYYYNHPEYKAEMNRADNIPTGYVVFAPDNLRIKVEKIIPTPEGWSLSGTSGKSRVKIIRDRDKFNVIKDGKSVLGPLPIRAPYLHSVPEGDDFVQQPTKDQFRQWVYWHTANHGGPISDALISAWQFGKYAADFDIFFGRGSGTTLLRMVANGSSPRDAEIEALKGTYRKRENEYVQLLDKARDAFHNAGTQ